MSIETPAGTETAPRAGQGRRTEPKSRPRPLPSPVTGRISPSAAAISRPMLVLLPVLTLLVPGIVIAMLRQPVYSAEARLLVGSFDVESQAVPGVVEASQSLAETYSRLIVTDDIIADTAAELGVPPQEVRGTIGASSIPNSAIIRVEAQADSAAEAAERANAAAQALVEYASGGSGEGVLPQYEEALLEASQARIEVERLQEALEGFEAAGNATAAATVREQLAAAEVRAERARVRSESLGDRYSRETSGGSSGTLQLVGEAVDAGSDRRSTFQVAVGIAVALGLIIGVALATVVVNRQYAARLQPPTRGT